MADNTLTHNNTPDDRPSKTQRKRDMHALQELGNQLVELGPDQLRQLPLSDTLHGAIIEARRITSREARRRQMQYVGKLMRNADAQAIRHQLEIWRHGTDEDTRAMHHLEALRDVLIDSDDALTEFLQTYPATDVQALRALIRAARKEAQQNAQLGENQPPQRKHYRALYQALKNITQTLDEQ